MEALIIHPDDKSLPSINLNPADGEFRIQGRSTPDNPMAFYQPVFDFFSQYKLNPCKQNNLHIYLEYFNTSTSKCLFDIFTIFTQIHKAGNEVTVYWYYIKHDEDMLESGKDFEEYTKLPFKYQIAPRIYF